MAKYERVGGWIAINDPEIFTDEVRMDLTLVSENGNPILLYSESSDGRPLIPVGYAIHRLQVPLSAVLGNFAPSDRLSKCKPIGLRQEQLPVVAEMGGALTERAVGILHAPCGSGKTVMALELARGLGQRTVVLVHKEFLLDQWADRIAEHLPGVQVGRWQQGVTDIDGRDIVLAMVQSLVSKRMYDPILYRSFGLVITDEVHRHSSPVWQRAITRFPANFRLGLTATPTRRDGTHPIFFAHSGPIASSLDPSSTVCATPSIWRVSLPTVLERRQYVFPWKPSEVNTGKLITLLAKDRARTEAILSSVRKAVLAGRKILILTERLEHVSALVEGVTRGCPTGTTVAPYIGGMTEEARDDSARAQVIVGTYGMAQEGLDIPPLDTLFLATPKVSIAQSVGRILRIWSGKHPPIVVDFVDHNIPILEGYFKARMKVYRSLGYPVRN